MFLVNLWLIYMFNVHNIFKFYTMNPCLNWFRREAKTVKVPLQISIIQFSHNVHLFNCESSQVLVRKQLSPIQGESRCLACMLWHFCSLAEIASALLLRWTHEGKNNEVCGKKLQNKFWFFAQVSHVLLFINHSIIIFWQTCVMMWIYVMTQLSFVSFSVSHCFLDLWSQNKVCTSRPLHELPLCQVWWMQL